MSSRRSTLGPLSLNAQPAAFTASRKSLGAITFQKAASNNSNSINNPPASSGVSGSATATPSGDRLSLSRLSLAGRRNSASAASSKPAGSRPDPRPIGDKTFLRDNIKRLIMYLASHNYPRQVSPKLLMAPSGKDFRHIMEFLFQQYDPGFEFDAKIAFEEEVKKFMKLFGYPMSISKQSLSAPGIPHTWPAILAMIVWLVEYLQYNEKVANGSGANNFTGTGLANKLVEHENSEKLFFDYTAAAYGNFLAGSDNSDELDAELRKSFELKNQAINIDLQAMRTEKRRLLSDVDSLKKSADDFQQLKASKANLTQDMQKFQHIIEELNKHKAQLDAKIEERTALKAEQQQQLAAATVERDRLLAIVNKQEYTPIQVQSMAHQRAMLEESVQSLAKQKERVQADFFQVTVGLNKRSEEFRARVGQFNETAQSNNIQDKQGNIIQIEAIEGEQPGEFTITPSLSAVVSPCLSHSLSCAVDAIARLKDEGAQGAEQLNAIEEAKQEHSERLANFDARLKKLDDTYKSEKESMHKELSAAVCRVEDEELAIHKLKASASIELDNSYKQLELLDQELAIQAAGHQKEKRHFNASLFAAMDALVAHKERLQERLRQIQQQAAHTKAGIAAL